MNSNNHDSQDITSQEHGNAAGYAGLSRRAVFGGIAAVGGGIAATALVSACGGSESTNSTTGTTGAGGGGTEGTMNTRLGALTFDQGLPDADTRQKLYDELDFQRAVQNVIWAEPAVNNALFQKAMVAAGVPNLGAMVYDARQQPGQQTLTPNQSVTYLYDSINLKDTGPVVHTFPACPANAGLFDMWMRPILDFGTVGPNKGQGDRILILPPGYTGEVPDGYQVARSKNWQIFSITRITVNKDWPTQQAVDVYRQVQTYRLADAAAPPKKTLVLMGDPAHGGKPFPMNRPAGLDYWHLVHEIIDTETIEDRDRITLGTLAEIGIERGQPFAPDDRMKKILVDAEQTGHLMMINEAFSPRAVPRGLTKELYPGTQWENIQLLPDMTQEGPNFTYVTNRMVGYYQANGAQFAWKPQNFPPGFGQKYAAAYKDGDGNWLTGDKHYRLTVPANVPVADFWAVTVYDTELRALIEAPQHRAEFNPNIDDLVHNDDGSIDLHIGPEQRDAPAANWIQTVPGRSWFLYFRWYGPTEAFYDKSWKLDDVKPV
ncbi:DUF1254 domain-containing protein [Mycolicibacterium senegalense]|uniref:DUF1254 domain-containing protein n=1 Tax=Mycolicibacterium TaxID=1866885 RepID=UPI003204EFC7